MSTTFNELLECEFFRESEDNVSSIVGWDARRIRFVRYKFTAPKNGANRISILKDRIGLREGTDVGMRFFVSESPDLWSILPENYANTGWGMSDKQEGGYYTFMGSANVVLLPDKNYYLYIFPGQYTNNGMYSWNYNTTITVTLDGGAGVVRIRDGDQEFIAIPMVKEGGTLVQLSATIKNGSDLVYCI